MPYNGSGSYSPPGANYPAVSATLITAANRNAIDADIATALSTAITKDGQTTPTANLPMGGFKLTGMSAGSAVTDSATIANLQAATGVYVATVGGTADVITLTPVPAITAYAAGQVFRFIASGANTTNVTVNVNALGAKAITKNGAAALVAGDIPSATIVEMVYDGTQFQLAGSVKSTLVDAKGDLLTGTAADTVARLAAGSNGTALKADSTTTEGLRYGLIEPGFGSIGQTSANNTSTPNTQFDLNANYVKLWNPTTGDVVLKVSPGALTNNISTAGPIANGRDQAGAFSAGFVHFYWIYNGTTTAALSSATAPPTGPTLPTGYTHWSYACAAYFDGAALRAVHVKGSWVWHDAVVNAVTASTTTTEASVSMSAIVPSNALNVELHQFLAQTGAATGSPIITAKTRVITTKDFDTVTFFPSAVVNVAMVVDRTLRIPNISQNFFVILSANASTDGSPQLTVDVNGYQVPNGGE